MSNIINADNGVVSGIAGVKLSSDSTGVLDIQTNGTTAITISTAQVVSLTNSPTFTGGTANGVLYLNASKVATSGSALTFDSTQMDIGVGGYYGRLNLARSSGSPYATMTLTDPSNAANEVGIYLRSTGTNPAGISTAGAPLAFYNGGPGVSEKMRLDASGNLGLGVTPSAWSVISPALQLGSAGTFLAGQGATAALYLGTNAYYDGSNFKYSITGAATYYQQNGGAHRWYNAASGSANATISFTQALTLNTSGNLVLQGGSTGANGIGVTFPASQSASSDANCLDDYEEGSWTPTAVCTGQTIAYTSRSGSYTKIGNMVRAQCVMIISTVSGAAGGNTTITGLPFSNGGGTYSGQGAIGYNDGFAGTVYGTWISGTDVLFRSGTRSSGNDASGFTAGGYIYIVWIYNV